ncbi:nucleophile aminohydrolase [Tirmania nivea]|nr:nucleophile aminohydrolase [Tirmania nivea]
MPEFMRYPSRRSVVHSTHGMVACTQPLAAQAGIRVLREGGNAADAAVAVAAVLSLTEPPSTGIGGDMFCLYYNPATRRVHSLNGSGRSPRALTLSHALATIPPRELEASHGRIPTSHIHAVTVPGAAAGWCDTVARFGSGRLGLAAVLAPAIELAEEGVPVSSISAQLWKKGEAILRRGSPHNYSELLPAGRAPREGEVVRFPGLAQTYRILAEKGKKGFYEGEVAHAIVAAVRERRGVMTLEDLSDHGERGSEEMDPICLEIPWGADEHEGRKKVWECAPNGQGLVALQALGILDALQERGVIPVIGSEEGYAHNSVDYLHALISALRISFSDSAHFIGDPDFAGCIPQAGLLRRDYLQQRSQLFDPRAPPAVPIPHGSPASCDTVYFCVADAQGGACSFINSLFTDFGSGVIPAARGFALHNRGAGFVLAAGHANALQGGKRPYHTIISAMVTGAGERLHTVLGVMGGYMQPQGHVQVLLNMLAFGMSPQEALDAPRVCVGAQDRELLVHVEVGVRAEVVAGLRDRGYSVVVTGDGDGEGRAVFGRGQVIRNGVGAEGAPRLWSGGSDMRGDGACVGY